MSCNLNSIPCAPGPIMGGLKAIHILRWEDALSVPSCCGKENLFTSDPINIKVGKAFVSHHFRPGSMKYSYKQKSSPNGPIYETEIFGYIDKLRGEVDQEIAKTAPGLYILVTEGYDDEVRMHGSIERPLRFEAEADIGARKRDNNRTSWRFFGSDSSPACYMDPSNPIPHYSETDEPLVLQMGANNPSGVFVPFYPAEYLAGASHSFRMTGQVYESDGITPSPPAVGKELLFDIYFKTVNNVLEYKGEVKFNYSAPIIFGDAVPANNTQPTTDPNSVWPLLEAFFEPGSGVDATGAMRLDFSKGDWAISQAKTHLDAVDIFMIGRIRKAGLDSIPSASHYPIIATDIEYAKFNSFLAAFSNPDTISYTALFNLDGWSLSSDYRFEVGDNVFSVPLAGTYVNASPTAGSAGITNIDAAGPRVDVTYSNFGSWTHPFKCEVDVTHDETGVQRTIKFETHQGTLSGPGSASLMQIYLLQLINTIQIGTFSMSAYSRFYTEAAGVGFSGASDQNIYLDALQVASNFPVGPIQQTVYPLDKRLASQLVKATATSDHTTASNLDYEVTAAVNLLLI